MRNFLLALGALCCLFPASLFAADILIINSYHRSYPWSQACLKAFEKNIGDQHNIHYIEMDTKRIHRREFKKQAKAAWEHYEDIDPDIVVLMDDNALKYLGPDITDDGTPVIFMGVNNDPVNYFDAGIPKNLSGILERPNLKQSAYLVEQLLPASNRSKLMVMMDAGATSYAIIKTSLAGKSQISFNDHHLRTYLTSSWEEWKRKVRKLPTDGYDALLLGNYATIKDRYGRQIPLDEVAEWTSVNSKIPVMGVWRFSIGTRKALGGLVISGKYQGEQAAELTKITLRNGKTPAIRTPLEGELVFSESELARWQIVLPAALSKDALIID